MTQRPVGYLPRRGLLFDLLLVVGLVALVAAGQRDRRLLAESRDERRQLADSVAQQSRMERLANERYRRILRSARFESDLFLTGELPDGRTTTVDLSKEASPTLVVVFDPSCPGCLANLPVVERFLPDSACRVEIRNIYVGADEGSSSWRKRLGSNALYSVRGPAMEVLGLAETPLTMLILPRGKFGGVWSGELRSSALAEIESVLAQHCRG